MKFAFNIQITNQSHPIDQGKIEFRLTDFDLLDMSDVYDKAIHEHLNILPNISSECFKTESETKLSFAPMTFRSDIHSRSSIELQLEEPKTMLPERENTRGLGEFLLGDDIQGLFISLSN